MDNKYIKQTWVDLETPVDAEHLNHMEGGIEAAHAGVAALTEEIDDLSEHIPQINTDTETHHLLEVEDIDSTLSIEGKPADAKATGDAIATLRESATEAINGLAADVAGKADKEGDYELIESITFTEDAILSRETEPDGTPYSFDAVLVRLATSANQAGTNLFVKFDDKSSSMNGNAWLASLANNTGAKRAYFWCEKNHGRWFVNLRPFTTAQSVAKLETDVLHHSASKITGVASTVALSAGMTVEIYGVRPKGV